MNAQPDISADDSPRLKELCRVTAMEIKAVGSVGAATSLEMIGYIRELERGAADADDYVAWCRYVYNTEGGIQTIVTCDSDAKGAFKVYRAAPTTPPSTLARKAAEIDIEKIIHELAHNPQVCVCKPFCVHWEVHAKKVIERCFAAESDQSSK